MRAAATARPLRAGRPAGAGAGRRGPLPPRAAWRGPTRRGDYRGSGRRMSKGPSRVTCWHRHPPPPHHHHPRTQRREEGDQGHSYPLCSFRWSSRPPPPQSTQESGVPTVCQAPGTRLRIRGYCRRTGVVRRSVLGDLPGSPRAHRYCVCTRRAPHLCGVESSAAAWLPVSPAHIPEVLSLLWWGLPALCAETPNTDGHKTGHVSLLSWDYWAVGSPRVSRKGGKVVRNLRGFLKLCNFPIWLFWKPNHFPKVTASHTHGGEAF